MIFYFSSAIIAIVVILFLTVRIVFEWKKGVWFRLGKYKKEVPAGWHFIIPLIDGMELVDMRIRTMSVVPQEVMTKDSVPVKIDAVVYYQITNATKSILAVNNFEEASTLLAQSKLRDVMGKYDLDMLLSNKEQIGKEVLDILQAPTYEWGIKIISVEIKNIEIPDNMKRAMAKEAEAIREKRSRLVKASAEEEASEKFLAAAKALSESPNALALRQLQTWQEIGAEQNSLIIVVPSEFGELAKKLQK